MPRGGTYKTRLETELYSHPKPHEKQEKERILSVTGPLVIHPYPVRYSVEVTIFPGSCYQIQKAAQIVQNKDQQIRPRALRLAFQQVDSPAKMADFLTLCGPFREPFVADHPQRVEWSEFVYWHHFMSALQQGRTPAIFHDVKDALIVHLQNMVLARTAFRISHQPAPPQWECTPQTALEMIAAVISADELSGLPLRRCDGCANLYPVEFAHDRENNFCSPMCRKRHWRQQNAARCNGINSLSKSHSPTAP